MCSGAGRSFNFKKRIGRLKFDENVNAFKYRYLLLLNDVIILVVK